MPVEGSLPELIADRYRVKAKLGQGGMAVVYRVLDNATKRELALKRLLFREDEQKRQDLTKLFEHEFHTLSQLAHPRVVEVYDYGVCEGVPYYTMELLDGGDLKGLAPLPWKTVCSLLRDICSALSLLHSRRQVHRDLTPRNVHCTRDGTAKLIDFGAMVPMGPCKKLVGTPPFTAPEAVYSLSLDARTDLYSLGATAYYALTQKFAYSVSSFGELHSQWRTQPKPPSSLVKGIPEELDRLVLALLSLDFLARPVNAAEVMDRLSAIAGLEIDERLVVARAHLSTPTLVGREAELLRVRKQIIRTLRHRGGTLMIEGESGVGRSRFLDACVLEGKVAGVTVLRAGSSDAYLGDWGTVRSLVGQLLNALPGGGIDDIKPYLSVLGHVFPELIGRVSDSHQHISAPPLQAVWEKSFFSTPSSPRTASELGESQKMIPDGEVDFDSERRGQASESMEQMNPRSASDNPPEHPADNDIELVHYNNLDELRPRIQANLLDFLLNVSHKRCLMVAVDDFHKLDEPSAALIALLGHEIKNQMVIIAATYESNECATSEGALRVLRTGCSSIELNNIELAQTEQLLSSVFGDVPNLKLLADRLQSMSKGNPRTIMQMAQYLIDESVIRYQSGAWILPSRMDIRDLSYTLEDAYQARIEKLSNGARLLAGAMALSPEQSFTFEECIALSEHRVTARVVSDLDELVAYEILSTDGDFYSISQQGWYSTLTKTLDSNEKRSAHLRIAAMFDSQGTGDLRVTKHLLQAGEEERALDHLINTTYKNRERLQKSAEETARFFISLPKDWSTIYGRIYQICKRSGRPQMDLFSLHYAMVAFGVIKDECSKELFTELINILYRAAGLELYHQLQEPKEPSERIVRALEFTQQTYDSTPEAERTLAPADAIHRLAHTLIFAIKLSATRLDNSLIESVPSLEPFFFLSPALILVEQNVKSTGHFLAGRLEQARQGYLDILYRLAKSDRGGLEESYYRYINLSIMWAVGLSEAMTSMRSALKWADRIEQDPLFQVNAWRLRLVYYMYQGETEKVDKIREQIELLQIQNSPAQYFEGQQLWCEMLICAASDDLNGIKQLISSVEKMVDRFDTWSPVLHFVRGEYQRMRGDYSNALSEHEEALRIMAPGQHLIWKDAAGALIKTLMELKRDAEAVKRGRQFLQQAEEADLGVYSNTIREPLSLAEARLGQFEVAIENNQRVINSYEVLGIGGIRLGLAYETRARIATLMNDQESFRSFAELCSRYFRVRHNPALTAKYERLLVQARRSDLYVSKNLEQVLYKESTPDFYSGNMVTQMFADCKGPRERAQCALDLLLRYGKSSGGFLYTMQKMGPTLSAKSDDQVMPAKLDVMVQDYLSAELESVDEATLTSHDQSSTSVCTSIPNGWSTSQGKEYRPILLGHNIGNEFVITGLAVLAVEPNQELFFPVEAVLSISKFLHDAGDVVTSLAAI